MAAEDYLPNMSEDDEDWFPGGTFAKAFAGPTKAFHKPKTSVGFLQPTEEAPNNGKNWGNAESHAMLAHLKAGCTVEEVAKRFGRTPYAIECRAKVLGLDPSKVRHQVPVIKSKELNVKETHLLTLLQKDYTTIKVKFFDGTPPSDSGDYTYKAPHSMQLAKDDKVVVYGGARLKVARVAEVHEEPQIDMDAPYALKWVVQKVDLAYYEEQQAREAAALAMLNQRRKEVAVKEALETLFGDSTGISELRKLLNG